MNIYEGNSNQWGLPIIIWTETTFRLVRQYDENEHEFWKALMEKYKVSEEKQESLNEVTNRWNKCSIKDTSQDSDIWFNELYSLNLKFKKIKAKYGKDEDKLNAHVFNILPE